MASKSANHGLSQKELNTILKILRPYSDKIEKVSLFGSRATKTFRANSDIDLVLYGPINEATKNQIFTLFNESNLSLTVDLNVYQLINYSPLKKHLVFL